MKSSLGIIFLGWWLTRQGSMVRGQGYPAPSISVRPSAVVALGGNVTIRCKSEIYQQRKFVLFGGPESEKMVMQKQAEKYEVTFSITHATYSDRGIYRCYFENSHWSENAHIWIRKQIYPKPSISVKPKELVSLNENVAIHCKNEDNRLAQYSLIKEGALRVIHFDISNRKEAVFTIANVDQSKVGIYWCDYGLDSDYQYSHFSERVYINVTDHGFAKPSITMAPQGQHALGENVKILCEGPENNLTFFLHKSMDLRASRETKPGSNRTTFLVQLITLEDAGNYTCQYHKSGNPFVWSVSSNPAQLVVEDKNLIIMWASIAAGCLFLVLLILLLACTFYRRRRKGSTAKVTNQPVAMTLKPVAEADPDEVSYAVLRHCSLKIKPTADSNGVSEPCVYASVTK